MVWRSIRPWLRFRCWYTACFLEDRSWCKTCSGLVKTFRNKAKSAELTLSPPIPLTLYILPYWSNPPYLIFDISARMSKINKRLCYCRGTARRATSVEILWPFLTKLLTRSSANPQEPCKHTVSWNRVKCCTNVRRIACENVCNRWMTSKVIQGHCCCHYLIGHILFHISLPL